MLQELQVDTICQNGNCRLSIWFHEKNREAEKHEISTLWILSSSQVLIDQISTCFSMNLGMCLHNESLIDVK